jgi:hypothetical protein
MPISDLYVVQYVLQATASDRDPILWQGKGSEGYFANFRGVRIGLDTLYGTSGSRLTITLSHGWDKVSVEEPHNRGLFRESFENEDQRRLARLMNDLARCVQRQHSTRARASQENAGLMRQALYRKLLFGGPDAKSSECIDVIAS